ncbi:phosphohydrolase [Marinobacter halophilus]|uniref:Phosphohydrolase n=1 Tax=Marinobacter halophilus TaxID=1323740 RepID=A0A2T1KIQ6_9GAMM|nr:phosphohydrolase [Marinobacter halophilus]
MGVQQNKIAVHDLEVGMFVSDLDRPWHQTPFPIQGFYIRSQSDVRALVSHCKWVMVDVAENRDSTKPGNETGRSFRRSSSNRGNGREELQLPPLSIREPVSYQAVTPLKKELKSSRRLLDDAEVALARMFASVQTGQLPDLRPAADIARKMVASVARQPNALLWLSRTRQYDDFVYRHALNTAVWALVCGRQLGLNESLLSHLGVGCLLSQVGKTALPKDLLAREHQLNPEEFAVYRSYVVKGVEMLEHTGLSRAVMNVVQGHRERHNGSGFPLGLRGDRIALLAKVAGIAEFFESMTAPREGQSPMTPAKAVALLYDMRNIEFQEDLVEGFIQAIGVYPTGSLVELSDGQRGIVVSHSPERRLWPKVMVMQGRDRQPLKIARIIDLAKHNESRPASEALTVRDCLPHGTEGLDPSHHDVTGAESRWSLNNLISR